MAPVAGDDRRRCLRKESWILECKRQRLAVDSQIEIHTELQALEHPVCCGNKPCIIVAEGFDARDFGFQTLGVADEPHQPNPRGLSSTRGTAGKLNAPAGGATEATLRSEARACDLASARSLKKVVAKILSQHLSALARVQSASNRGARLSMASVRRSRRKRARASSAPLVIVSLGVTGCVTTR